MTQIFLIRIQLEDLIIIASTFLSILIVLRHKYCMAYFTYMQAVLLYMFSMICGKIFQHR